MVHIPLAGLKEVKERNYIMKKKILSLLFAGVLALASLAGCGNASGSVDTGNANAGNAATEEGNGNPDAPAELQTIRLAVMTGGMDQYVDEVAQWQGFFANHGINAEITEYVYGIATIDAIVNGTADIGDMADYATVNRLGNTYGVTDLKIFSDLGAPSGDMVGGLYVAPEYADDLASLDGSKGFMSTIGTVVDYYVAKAIEYLGFDFDNQNIIAVDSAQTALAVATAGNASAYFVSGEQVAYFEEIGWKKVATAQEIGVSTTAYLLATEGFISDNTELLAEYLLAVDEAIDFINNNLDETAEYLAQKLSILPENFKANWQNRVFEHGLNEDSAQHLEEVEKWAFEAGRFETDYSVREFYDVRPAEIAFPDAVTVVLN